MIILGIDPGFAIVGFGAIESVNGKHALRSYGAIRTAAGIPFPERLSTIASDMDELLESIQPDAVCIEELFFNTNLTTGIQVAHARGVILLSCVRHHVPIFEYTPLQVKQAVVGYGRAEKHQVMEMVRILLHMDHIPKPDDAADALAIALCHSNVSSSARFQTKNFLK